MFQIKCLYVTYLGLSFCIDNCFLQGEMKIYRPIEIFQHTTIQLTACTEFRSRVSTPFDHFVITGEIILLRLTRNGCLRGRRNTLKLSITKIVSILKIFVGALQIWKMPKHNSQFVVLSVLNAGAEV